ncbi:hypothetical protein vBAspABolek_01 [Aeromonas phage vB_AspA_Bolek]|nr:hypothetical protein vBAspABolek_01 [Aeromonas phage vB_AspA_Bolek]
MVSIGECACLLLTFRISAGCLWLLYRYSSLYLLITYHISMLLPPVRCKGSHHISPLSLY